jgi:hypothetical protein
MPQFLQTKWLPYLLLVLLAIPLFYLNVHEQHSWGGDDYALYIKEADNISKGIPFYKTNFVFYDRNITYSPPQYPPGFPLLLAPVVKVWGLAIKPMLCFITVMVVAFMLAAFAWLRKRGVGDVAGICISLLLGYSWFVVDTKDQVLSDIPCLLFTMLYFSLRRAGKYSWVRVATMVACAEMAMLIRTQSVLILGAEILFLLYAIACDLYNRRKIDKSMLLPAMYIVPGVVVLNLILSKTVFYVPSAASSFYANYLGTALHDGVVTLFRNSVNFVMEVLNGCFYYPTDHGFRTALVTIMQGAGLTLCLAGFVMSVSRRLSIEDIFFALMLVMMLYYPIHDKRYFLPAIAMVYYYCYYALKTILPAITTVQPRTAGVAITVIVLFTGLKYLRETTATQVGYVPGNKDRKAFAYLATHVADNELILFSRPRFLTLYTNKRAMVQAWLLPMEQNRQIFDSMQVKYALTVKGLADDFNNHYLHEVQQPLDSVVIADGYTLYRLR